MTGVQTCALPISYEPRLAYAIEQENLATLEHPPKVRSGLYHGTAKHWQIIVDAMQKVVHAQGGTAHRISQGLRYTIAGKTGTAQVFGLKQNEKYVVSKVKAHLRDHSWFIAFTQSLVQPSSSRGSPLRELLLG